MNKKLGNINKDSKREYKKITKENTKKLQTRIQKKSHSQWTKISFRFN